MALAYFLTFTTYGTWLPGSAKGKGSVDHEHNVHGMPLSNPTLRASNMLANLWSSPPT
jgi:hypothetical protein